MMQSIVNNTGQPYTHCSVNAAESVTNMYKGGVPIPVGSDANLSPYVPANPPFGLSLHEELELLVAAGVSPIDAIRRATSLVASNYRLYDRGTIAANLRADLVLLSADPTVDIRNSRSIKKVWIHGVEMDPLVLIAGIEQTCRHFLWHCFLGCSIILHETLCKS